MHDPRDAGGRDGLRPVGRDRGQVLAASALRVAADEIARSLGGYGRVALLTTTGRRSGRPRQVAVGFVDDQDGSVLVAAGVGAAWADNIEADPRCVVVIGERRFEAVAELLDRREHAAVIAALILRYGTPSERLGRGPSFRLRPVSVGAPG